MKTEAPQTVQTIHDRALLAQLRVSQFTGRKFDREAGEEVARTHNAGPDAGRYNKILLAKDALKVIQSTVTRARTFHYEHTLPWTDDGMRILPSTMLDEYMDFMRGCRGEFEEAVREFVADYPGYVKEARRRLGTLFRQEDYPSHGEVNGKFKFDVGFFPIPSSDDFRVPQAGELAAQLEERVGEAVGEAVQDVWRRVYETVGHMVERLKAYRVVEQESGKGKGSGKGNRRVKVENPFRDSTVENLRELVGLMPKLNITGDAEMDRMGRRLEKELCEFDADQLRESEETRESVRRKAQRVLRDLEAVYGAAAPDKGRDRGRRDGK